MSTFNRILKKPNFWPLFGAQALGAFNDNFFRSALIAYVAFGGVGGSGAERSILGALATGLMMLPFFLFSSVAGELADKLRKSRLVKITKAAEVGMMSLAALFFWQGQIYALLAVLFLMGTQSAFFGPLKYGLLPEVLDDEDLVAGNGLVEAATFLAIVLGTLAGSWLVNQANGTTIYLPLGLVLIAIIGLALALKQPQSMAGQSDLAVNPKIWVSTKEIVASVKGRRSMWLAILAISWFWAMGSILITQIPVLCSTVMKGTPEVNAFLVTMFALGVGLGSIGVQWMLKGVISARLVPISAGFLGFFLILLALSVWQLPQLDPTLAQEVTLNDFFSQWEYLRLGLSCFLVSITGGIFVVPLNALIQHLAEPHERSRVIAANNIVNAFFICAGSLMVMVMTAAGLGLHHVFAFVAISAVAVAGLTLYFLPDQSLKSLAAILLKIFFRPKVSGLEHIENLKDGPALLVANHTSFIDVVLLVAYIPRRLTFAIDSYWAQAWWIRPLLKVFKALPVNPTQPLATRSLIESLNNGELVVIFPEGRITTTGNIMKIYEGPGLISAKTKAPILPVIIDGPQYSRYGRFARILRNKPENVPVTMTIMAARHLDIPQVPNEKQRDYRHRASDALFTLLTDCLFKAIDCHHNLWTALEQAAHRNGCSRQILEDAQRQPVTYRGLMMRAKLLGRRFSSFSAPGECVGVMLPNSIAATATIFGLWAAGRVAVMMNFTQGLGPMSSAIKTAEVQTILTSRAFLANAGLEEMAAKLPGQLVYLEDLAKFSWLDKISGAFWRPTPAPAEAKAVMVFTSGSEGKPKGVALSHTNILSNIHQLRCQFEVGEDDSLFNALPMFHAFGLTVGVLLPLLIGMRCFNYLTPLHTKVIPQLIYDTQSTMVIGSDTFALAWGKNAHPYDFNSVRVMLVGAEKLKQKTKELYFEKFGIRIFEGYGTSEASPVLAVNCHMKHRFGTVGPIVPGVEVRIDPVDGVAKGGRLVVKGPNVMLGYVRPEQPGVIVPPEDGWYDTGDIVEIDADGFLWIKGRFKRFAKIGGEMVSLTAIEEVAATVWPGQPQVVIAVEDDLKGEKLVFVTQDQNLELPRLWQALKEAGQQEITFPKQSIYLETIPITPLGKINMPQVLEAAMAAMANGRGA